MTWPKFIALCGLSLLAWAIIGLGLYVATAKAYAPGEQVRERLEAYLRADLPDRPVLQGDAHVMATCGGSTEAAAYGLPRCWGLAYPDHILIDAEVVEGMQDAQTAALLSLVHETLHRDDDDRLLDEGIVQAVAVDACPSIAFAMWGVRGPCDEVEGDLYWQAAAGWRLASARATGARVRSWTARRWRAGMLLADHDERERVYRELVG